MNTSKAYETLIRRGMEEHPRLLAGLASDGHAIHTGAGTSEEFTQMIHPDDAYALVLHRALVFLAEVVEDNPDRRDVDWSPTHGWMVGDELFEDGLEAVIEATKYLEPKEDAV